MAPVSWIAPLLAGAISIATAGGAQAHPHVWIDMRTATLLDPQGRISGVRVEWLFDQFYSAYAEEDLDTDRNGKITEAEANRWAANALGNIAKVGYFAEFLVDGRSSAPASADTPLGRWRGGRVWMSFVIRPQAPVDPRAATFGYLSYDPEFYIDIRHPEKGVTATVEGPDHDRCTATVGRSDPSPEVIASAAALDRDATAPSGLGRLFADYVKVTCR